MQPSIERRAYRRLPLTMTARMLVGSRSLRTEILDLSHGGLLLASADAFTPAVGDTMEVQALPIGTVTVEVVAVSRLGIHVKIRDASPTYQTSVRRLSAVATTWSDDGKRS